MPEQYGKHVFVSHASVDKERIWPIVESLQAAGVSTWIDALEMRPGSRLFREISVGIETSAYVAAMLSPASINSSWVQEEIRLALSDEFYDENTKVIPCLLEKCELPKFLRDRIYCDFTQGMHAGITALLKGVHPESHVIALRLDPNNPLQLIELDLRNEFNRIFSLTQGVQEFIFVLDFRPLISELNAIWDSYDHGKLLSATDPMPVPNLQLRRTVPFALKNLSAALTAVSSLVQEYSGRRADLTDTLIRHLQQSTKFVLYDIWTAISSVTAPADIEGVQNVSGKAAVDALQTIDTRPDRSSAYPPPSLEAAAFECSYKDLLYIGIAGAPPVMDSRIYVPEEAFLNDTREYMTNRFQLRPDDEIPRSDWLNYFVPSIVRSNVRECSASGQYLGMFLNKFSLRKEDYRHIGLE